MVPGLRRDDNFRASENSSFFKGSFMHSVRRICKSTRFRMQSELGKISLMHTSPKVNCMAGRRILVLGGTLSGPTAAARAREIDESAEITIIQGGAHLSFAFAGLAHYLSGEVADLSHRT